MRCHFVSPVVVQQDLLLAYSILGKIVSTLMCLAVHSTYSFPTSPIPL